ncbi:MULTISPECIES: helix-turn-helix domain-containing protein [Nesterenkonia]|uniref:HTH cro/C1-type domain-containing protein n=2 Tax=Actinomycetes TaxID=1760 RepID=A0ABP6LSA8_9MICC|nr:MULTISPECIES: helix-turn-helix transcriptional regulator [unclassified Nesterenkonia]MDS2171383.1 helix-turn-helix transcriptional regulator [Nesterenkonia sp. CL21]OSM44435.1 transcriptional regulator [Nesterenkonia sp. PF2B19]
MVRQPVTVNGVTRWKDLDVDAAPAAESKEAKAVVLRQEIGDVLRSIRQAEGRTLRDVSHGARVSLGYLSEVERGQKEASSELLASICAALDVPLSAMLGQVAERVAVAEGLHVPDTVPTEFQREFGHGVVPDGIPEEFTHEEFARTCG